MKYLTDTWPEALAFFQDVVGLHDAAIDDVRVLTDRCVLALSEIYKHSEKHGFHVAYKNLLVELNGNIALAPKHACRLIGYDIIGAELLPGSLWINTLAGNISLSFDSIRFMLSDTE